MEEGKSRISRTMLWVAGGVMAFDLTWKLMALWKAARRSRVDWFTLLGTTNTAGILPIIYIFAISPRQPVVAASEEEDEELREAA